MLTSDRREVSGERGKPGRLIGMFPFTDRRSLNYGD